MCVFLHTFDGDRFLPQLVKASFVDALAEVGIKPSAVLLENGYRPVVCKSKLRVHCMGAGIVCGDVDTQGVHCMGAGIVCGDVDTQGVHCMGAGIMCGDVDTQGVHCMGAGIMCGGCGYTRCALYGSRDHVWGMWTHKVCTVWEQCGDVDTQGVHCMGAGIMCGDVDTQGVHCMGAGIMCGGCGHTRCALFGSRDYVWGMWTQGILC